MRNKFWGFLIIIVSVLFLLWIEGCGNDTSYGGTEVGNPDSRDVKGKVAGKANADLTGKSVDSSASTSNCVADTFIATDSVGTVKTAEIAADCTFTLSLATNKTYSFLFSLAGNFVGALQFEKTTQVSVESVIVGTGTTAIDLGQISFSGTQATVQNNFFTQSGSEASVQAIFYEVEPRNEPDLTHPFFSVELSAVVKARASCELNQGSVTATTFKISSGTDNITCSFKFSGTGTGDRIECDHASQVFIADTIYTATIDGVTCSDGRSTERTTWSFRTKKQ